MPRPTREQIEAQFEVVHVTQSPSEAEAVAARLRGQDILAIAHARPAGHGTTTGGELGEVFSACVLVHETDLDRAHALLDAPRAEGDASREEIERALSEPARGDWYDAADLRRQRRLERRFWQALLLLVVAGVAAAMLLDRA